jgi:phosphoribosyl-AMP cyclohydrolase
VTGTTALEEGDALTPRWDATGLLPCVATHADTGEVLMLAYMNAEALERTLATGEVHYWSRSRGSSGIRGDERAGAGGGRAAVDCDQDAVWIKVRPGGDGGRATRGGAAASTAWRSGRRTAASGCGRRTE